MSHTQGYGTLVLDMQIKGVGRVKKSTGTNDPKVFNSYLEMMRNLKGMGRLDVLKAIQGGTVSIPEVWEYYRTQNLKNLPTVQHIVSLSQDLNDWIDGYDCAETTRVGYRICIKSLMGMNQNGTQTDLPEMVSDFRKRCQKEGITRHFNQTRAVALSYLSDRLNKQHPLYLNILAIKTVKVGGRSKGFAHTVSEVLESLERFRGEESAKVFWNLCITGMGWKEYVGEWEVKDDTLHIHGTKRESRDRKTMVVEGLRHSPKPTLNLQYFRRCLKKVNPTWMVYDGRRTFAHWCMQAGIPNIRIKMYMGHRVGANLTELYGQHDITPYIQEDTKKLNDYIDKERAKWLKGRKTIASQTVVSKFFVTV